MTPLLGAALLLAGVIALIKVFGVFPKALHAVHASRDAFSVMNDRALTDERKESLLQQYSLSLLKSFVDLFIRGAGSIAIPVALLSALESAKVLSFDAVLEVALSWPFLLGGAAASAIAFWFLDG
jgi:hypothetical protein